jgi:hypothetical protein
VTLRIVYKCVTIITKKYLLDGNKFSVKILDKGIAIIQKKNKANGAEEILRKYFSRPFVYVRNPLTNISMIISFVFVRMDNIIEGKKTCVPFVD